jgi:hypothetical protein
VQALRKKMMPPVLNARPVGLIAIVAWIERTYHRLRWQRALGKLTSIEFEPIEMASKAA